MCHKTKILYPISAYFPSQVGGPSNSLYWMCTGLKNSNLIETRVIATNAGIENNLDIKLNQWYNKDNNSFLFIKSNGLLPLNFILKSVWNIHKSHIIHLNSFFHSPSIIIAIINAIFFKKKIVVSVRGELYPYALETFRPKLKKIFIKLWKTLSSNLVIHCTVETEREYVNAIFNNKVETALLPNYILRPKEQEVLINNTNKYILFLGRLHQIKGLEGLLSAVKASKNFASSKIKIKLAGKGNKDYEAKLKSLVEEMSLNDKVEFLGQVEGEAKEKLIANAYFLILPSFTENFGNVVVEALMHGTPVIASKGTPWEILEKNKAGFWVDNTTESLSKTLNTVTIIKEKEYEAYRKNAKDIALREYDIENNYKNWERFYTNLDAK